jgi:hypothetical protein
MARSLHPAATAGLSALVLIAGCGSGTPPDEWASQICGALTPWSTQISDLNIQAQRQMTTARTPSEAKSHLLELLAGAERSSETARAAVAAAGRPDVPGGEDVARRFESSIEGARDAYAHARDDLAALPTQDATVFYDGVTAAMSRLNREYAMSAVDPSRLDSPELRRAFDGAEQCR